ncbi:myosin regulatory light chain 10 isoform X1 [Meriones unguiculatus]|uniref:myosin regulatory light chain 10 isoform X1 n=1 Tax=Meriones unguiculatus TaxID=10047 RepID=UPI00293E48DE|nr:myosin regulatory light chain 10 isoform X1 [Meriones unguiculatus]XP_060223884.1 myosin regulatory light chain 10 isoform X1 [Meriones unguiculatus]
MNPRWHLGISRPAAKHQANSLFCTFCLPWWDPVSCEPRTSGQASRWQFKDPFANLWAPRRARKRAEGTASSNVFSMFDQSQIQEFKEAFTIMDQNRDGFIDKEDLRDTFAALGRINVKNEELEAMLKGAPGPINFTVFLTMFGEKLKGTDPEETILHAFKVFDTEGKGFVKADVSSRCLRLSRQMCVATWTTGIYATSSRMARRRTRRRASPAVSRGRVGWGGGRAVLAGAGREVVSITRSLGLKWE